MLAELGFVTTAFNDLSKAGGDWLRQCLETPLSDNRVGDIVVSDDGSSDFDQLKDRLGKLSPRIKLRSNEVNCGPFINKLRAIANCQTEWVLCIDSDNWIDSGFIDALYAVGPWQPNRIYCPTFAAPKFDYRKLAGRIITADSFKESAEDLQCFINTGNQLVHRETYVNDFVTFYATSRPDLLMPDYFKHMNVNRNSIEHRRLFDCSDVFMANKFWLQAGPHRQLYAVPGLTYNHRWRADSVYSTAGKLKEALPAVYTQELRRNGSIRALEHHILSRAGNGNILLQESFKAAKPGDTCTWLYMNRSGTIVDQKMGTKR